MKRTSRCVQERRSRNSLQAEGEENVLCDEDESGEVHAHLILKYVRQGLSL